MKYVLALLLFFCTAQAQAELRFELAHGRCQTSAIGSGIWYQKEYPHELNLTVNCWQFGISKVTQQRGLWDLGVRFSVFDFGNPRMASGFAVLDEEQHLVPDGSACNPATLSGCTAFGHTVQRVQGIAFGGLVEREVRPKLRLGLEAGVALYSGSFDAVIDVNGAAAQRWVLHWQGEYLTPYIGATLQRAPLFFSVRRYTAIRAGEHNCGGCSGFSKDHVDAVLLGLSAPW